MIVVFVVDTSPSMSRPAVGDSGLSRLDVAKMAVENTVRQWRKMRANHTAPIVNNNAIGSNSPPLQLRTSLDCLGQWPVVNDQFLLLSTSRQHPDTASCAAGGRLLVGYGINDTCTASVSPQQQQQQEGATSSNSASDPLQQQEHRKAEAFQRELKGLKAATIPDDQQPFPEDAGGAAGLNQALSVGLQLLSRYRLHNRHTENFGMGRLPGTALPMPDGSWSRAALQPACLVLLTDGACLRLPPKQGGGTLQLKYGSVPLKELYQEPFRWDQRIFVQAVGAGSGTTSSQYLHPHLRTLCEVTGGAHWIVRCGSGGNSGNGGGSNSSSSSSNNSNNNLSQVTESLLNRIAPPMPAQLPLRPDPITTVSSIVGQQQDPASSTTTAPNTTVCMGTASRFVNAGPVCCFQSLEANEDGTAPPKLRALLLYTSSPATAVTSSVDKTTTATILGNPLFCIPESYFPSKKLDTLPPRAASPTLYYSKYPTALGSKSFDPSQVIKWLHRLDQLILSNRGSNNNKSGIPAPVKLLHRDVYVCDWLDAEGGKAVSVSSQILGSSARSNNSNNELFFPVVVPGAGRPSLSDDGENYLNVGILHVPANCTTLSTSSASNSTSSNGSRLATLTLLPPDPHILLPLLLRAAEVEHRALKKVHAATAASAAGATASLLKQQQSNKPPVVSLDESWRNDLRAYLFRLPPYYQFSIKRALRAVLPSSVHSLLHPDSIEAMAMQCFSKECHQRIRQGEQIAIDNNERLERQEEGLRRSHVGENAAATGGGNTNSNELRIGYGQFDPRSTVDSYLAALPSLPAPWRVPGARQRIQEQRAASSSAEQPRTAVDILGDLPRECLFAYYESRRRWLFGGPGVTLRGLHAEGVRNDGGNVQTGSKPAEAEECPLTLAGVGVSTLNHTTTVKMGEYRERLIFSRSPVVGYGSNDCAGVSATTAVDGSPTWSVDDDALPATFFDPKTGKCGCWSKVEVTFPSSSTAPAYVAFTTFKANLPTVCRRARDQSSWLILGIRIEKAELTHSYQKSIDIKPLPCRRVVLVPSLEVREPHRDRLRKIHLIRWKKEKQFLCGNRRLAVRPSEKNPKNQLHCRRPNVLDPTRRIVRKVSETRNHLLLPNRPRHRHLRLQSQWVFLHLHHQTRAMHRLPSSHLLNLPKAVRHHRHVLRHPGKVHLHRSLRAKRVHLHQSHPPTNLLFLLLRLQNQHHLQRFIQPQLIKLLLRHHPNLPLSLSSIENLPHRRYRHRHPQCRN